jgi:alkylated DNA nucleotide flippase Atl1
MPVGAIKRFHHVLKQIPWRRVLRPRGKLKATEHVVAMESEHPGIPTAD